MRAAAKRRGRLPRRAGLDRLHTLARLAQEGLQVADLHRPLEVLALHDGKLLRKLVAIALGAVAQRAEEFQISFERRDTPAKLRACLGEAALDPRDVELGQRQIRRGGTAAAQIPVVVIDRGRVGELLRAPRAGR